MKKDKKDREIRRLKKALAESRRMVETLEQSLNHVNLLNCKIFYTNKLFKELRLSNYEKCDVVDRFDVITSIREIKRLYGQLHREYCTITF